MKREFFYSTDTAEFDHCCSLWKVLKCSFESSLLPQKEKQGGIPTADHIGIVSSRGRKYTKNKNRESSVDITEVKNLSVLSILIN